MEKISGLLKKPRILLVVLESITLYVFGVRSLRAVLKANGFDSQILYVFSSQFDACTGSGVADFIELCKQFDIIGFSFMSPQFGMATQMAGHIKNAESSKIIILGGQDPTVAPDRNLSIADAVCIGEGERSFLEFVQRFSPKEPLPSVSGIWVKTEGNVVRTPLGSLIQNFDEYPTVDNNFSSHFVTHLNRIQKIDSQIASKYLYTNYMTVTSFGCSMSCTYCINNHMKKLYNNWGCVRRRPVDHIIAEFKDALAKIPRIDSIDLVDDDFCSAPLEYLEEFCEKYRSQIGLPLDVMGLSPADVIPAKLDLLAKMGAVKVRMGIQAVEPATKKMFKRSYSNSFLMKKVELLREYRKYFYSIRYDFIIDTPWDKADASLKTLEFISQMPRPFFANIYTLAFYPGTELYEQAIEEGLISEEDVWRGQLNENFMELKPTLINFLLLLISIIPISPSLLKRVTRKVHLEKSKSISPFLIKAAQLILSLKRFLVYVINGDKAQLRKLPLYMNEYRFLFFNKKT